MAIAIPPITADELEKFPDDGKRREIIRGELSVSPAPSREHQQLSMVLSAFLYRMIVEAGAGWVYAAPVDVRLSPYDQVQPDLLAIRQERLGIYHGHVVHGPPDIVIEILSPSSPGYDKVEKRRLYASAGVPEYWIVDPESRQLMVLRLSGSDYESVAEQNGRLRSTSILEFEIEPAALFARLSTE
ncbi:MAG: Uma2 family endonuclease [Thermomicrobiales bacterium]